MCIAPGLLRTYMSSQRRKNTKSKNYLSFLKVLLLLTFVLCTSPPMSPSLSYASCLSCSRKPTPSYLSENLTFSQLFFGRVLRLTQIKSDNLCVIAKTYLTIYSHYSHRVDIIWIFHICLWFFFVYKINYF